MSVVAHRISPLASDAAAISSPGPRALEDDVKLTDASYGITQDLPSVTLHVSIEDTDL